MELIIGLIAGALGGIGAGAIMKNFSLGTLGNSIVGILGGGLGTYLLGMMTGTPVDPAAAAGGLDIGSIISSIVSGGVGGGVLLAIVGALKGMMAK